MNNYYTNYITSSEWFSLRRKVFKMYGKYCRRCNSIRKLHVHHKTYERLGKECIETDLVVLCNKCHDKYHSKYKHTSIETTDLFIENYQKKIFTPKKKKAKKDIKLIVKPNKERQKKVQELKNLLGNKKIEKWQYFEQLRKL